MIHTIGDSHSMFGWNQCKGVIIHHIGPLLCYSFGKDKLNRINLKRYNVADGDTVIFCLGEIDCRCHIQKHLNEYVTYKEVINNLISEYICAILENSKQYANITVCIYNVVPPCKKEDTIENSVYPFLGSNEERKMYTKYFNELCKVECIKHNFLFIDVYDSYADYEGYLNKELSDGHVHIKNGSYLEEYLRKNMILKE